MKTKVRYFVGGCRVPAFVFNLVNSRYFAPVLAFVILAAVVLLFTFILGGYGLILAAAGCAGLLASCGD
jgi:hypothetical protein